MNIFLWTLQIILSLVCLGSGLFKTIMPEDKLIKSGQTGVQGLSAATIKFIGISEILIALGLVLPWYLNISPVLTPFSAVCFAVIMVLANRAHTKLYIRDNNVKEKTNARNNLIILALCLVVAMGRAIELFSVLDPIKTTP